MSSKLLQHIRKQFFIEDGKRIIVLLNRDGVLCREEFARRFKEEFGIDVFAGGSLELRLLKEISAIESPDAFFLFVRSEDFDILPDMEEYVEMYDFQTKKVFANYHFDTIKNEPFEVLEKLYEEYPTRKLSAGETADKVAALKENATSQKTVIENYTLHNGVDFNAPSAWINAAAATMLCALKCGRWSEINEQVDEINVKFQEYLKTNYAMIQASGCPMVAPRIVTHILPFIKRTQDRTALVVVDGMNYWQGLMLMESIESHLGRKSKCDCIYSWLPSTTELSRQAIFRGGRPDVNYLQNPTNEKTLWREFWLNAGLADYKLYYQHTRTIEQEHSVDRLAYVCTDLDEMMHHSKNYNYLYSNTNIWVNEDSTLAKIKHLLDSGFKVFITTDHGNIEGVPYKKLTTQEKLGADSSLRHITIAQVANERMFEGEHNGHITTITKNRTYYPAGRGIFHNEECVTHGGTHWLEVLIPFITIE